MLEILSFKLETLHSMADIFTIRDVFETILKKQWSKTPVAMDNVPFDPPQGCSWIRGAFVIDDTPNVNIGSFIDSRTRHTGNYIIQVFSPLNEGTGDHTTVVSQLIKLFQNQQPHKDILTYAGSYRRVGNEGNGWYQSNVIIPFTADQLGTD